MDQLFSKGKAVAALRARTKFGVATVPKAADSVLHVVSRYFIAMANNH